MKKIGALLVLLIVLSVVALPLRSTDSVAAQGSDGPAEKWCSGVKIVFFPGGPAGGVFAVNVYNGAVQAAADLGADVDYVWSDWDPQKMIQQFSEAMATGPDGIAIMGHAGEDAFEPLVDEAIAQGIIVTSQNTDLPRLETRYAGQGFGYVGQELYATGYNLGKETVKRAGLGEATVRWSGACCRSPRAACVPRA